MLIAQLYHFQSSNNSHGGHATPAIAQGATKEFELEQQKACESTQDNRTVDECTPDFIEK